MSTRRRTGPKGVAWGFAQRWAGLSILTAVMLAPPASAADFTGWKWKLPITFTNDSRIGTLTNFPALIKLSTNIASFSYGTFKAPSNGGDLRFTDASQTNELSYEIETWNTNGTSLVWVRVPLLTNSAGLYAWWGNDGATTPPAYTTNGTTWSENYSAVWHFASNLANSTARGNNGVNGSPGTTDIGGMIGRGRTCSGSGGSTIDMGAASNISGAAFADFAVSAWLRPTAITGYHDVFSLSGWPTALFLFPSCTMIMYLSGIGSFTVPGSLSVNVWSHLEFVRSGDTWTAYVNGAQVGSGPVSGAAAASGTAVVGADGVAGGENYAGDIDELAWSGAGRSSNWVWSSWANQVSNSAFVAYGEAAQTFDGIPPAGVTGLSAVGGQHAVKLRWTNSADTDSKGVLIVRKAGSAPTWAPTAGNTYATGQDMGAGNTVALFGYGSVATPGAAASFVDRGLVNGTRYYYVVYAKDNPPNYSGGASADAAATADTTAPADVAGLTAAGGARQVTLAWTNPADADFDSVLIVRRPNSEVAFTPAAETLYTNGQSVGSGQTVVHSGTGTNGTPGGASSFTDAGLDPAALYDYRVYAMDAAPNYAGGQAAGAYTAVENVKFVDIGVGASGSHDGSTWDNAYTNLAEALAAVGSGTDLWVAEGTYRDGVTYQMKNGVALYGGFTNGAPAFSFRDWAGHPARLDGQGARTVIRGADAAILDGFVVTNGRAATGGGMYNSGVAPTVRNCLFAGNQSTNWPGGGAIYHSGVAAGPTLIVSNCVFRENTAQYCGGLFIASGSVTLEDTVFASNASVAGYGGALCLCTYAGETLLAEDCRFLGNSAGTGTGGFLYNQFALTYPMFAVFRRCVIAGNYGAGSGGTIGLTDNSTYEDCVFSGNGSGGHGGIYHGGGMGSRFRRCVFAGMQSAQWGAVIGGYYGTNASPSFENCLFAGNVAGGDGGVLQAWPAYAARFDLMYCTLADNRSGGNGGALCAAGGAMAVTNCVFWGNSAAGGSSQIYDPGAMVSLNFSDIEGGWGAGTNVLARDPLFTGGPTGTWTEAGPYSPDLGQTRLTRSGAGWLPDRYQGQTVNPDTAQGLQFVIASNSADTLYVWGNALTEFDGAGLAGAGDRFQIHSYRLESASPCEDTAIDTGVTTDLAGSKRPSGGGFDMGAYESVPVILPGPVMALW